jgi:hypothetical protein
MVDPTGRVNVPNNLRLICMVDPKPARQVAATPEGS